MSNIKALQWRYAVKKFDAEKILPEAKIDIFGSRNLLKIRFLVTNIWG